MAIVDMEVIGCVAICRQNENKPIHEKREHHRIEERLSAYLNDVKAGEEILVRNRNQPVARIVPLVRSRDEEELLALASQGNCA